MVSNFCEWKKPVWKCPLDEKVRSLIRKNQCGIDTLRLEVPIFTRITRECIMRFVNKRLREKKDQCEVAKQCKSNPKKFWKYVKLLIVSLNHKPELVILKQWLPIIVS